VEIIGKNPNRKKTQTEKVLCQKLFLFSAFQKCVTEFGLLHNSGKIGPLQNLSYKVAYIAAGWINF